MPWAGFEPAILESEWPHTHALDHAVIAIGSSLVRRCRYSHYFYHGATAPSGPRSPHCRGITITLRHITLGRTSLDEWSTRRRDLYMSNTQHSQQRISMPSAGFEPATPKSAMPQAHALDSTATGIDKYSHCHLKLTTGCKKILIWSLVFILDVISDDYTHKYYVKVKLICNPHKWRISTAVSVKSQVFRYVTWFSIQRGCVAFENPHRSSWRAYCIAF